MNTKETAAIRDIFSKRNYISIISFLSLLAIATIVPLFHSQWITGPIVNAVLFISAVLLSVQSAVLIGLIPSIIALSAGLLNPLLAPMVPFIMLSNTILILVFNYSRKFGYTFGVVTAASLKFLFLFFTSTIVTGLIIKKEIASAAAAVLSWPQLITALIGGIIAFGVLKIMKKV